MFVKKSRTVFLSILVLFALVFALSGCTLFNLLDALNDDSVPQEDIFEYVKENHETLKNFPYDEMMASDLDEKDFIKQTLGKDTIVKGVWKDNGVLRFSCGGSGLSIGDSTYCGFYFSENDSVYLGQFEGMELIETSPNVFEGEGGRWTIRHEKIMDCWYYYYEEYN